MLKDRKYMMAQDEYETAYPVKITSKCISSTQSKINFNDSTYKKVLFYITKNLN